MEVPTPEQTDYVSLLRAAIEAANDAFLVTDASGRIVEYNQRFLDIWKLPPESLRTKHHADILDHHATFFEDTAAYRRRISEIHASPHKAVDLLSLNDGRTIERVSTVQLLNHRPVGRIWSYHDLTEWTRVEVMRSHLAAVVESAVDAIITKSPQGIITSWNASAERTFGYTAEEIIGRPVTVLFPADRIQEETEILARLNRGEKIEHYETQRVHKNGTVIDVSLTVSPMRDASGKMIGASKIVRDITARKQHEQEREALLASERAARSEAEHASQLKDDFLATLSHELRTPLNAILGWSQLLAQSNDASLLPEGLEAIQRNARAQTQLIEDLLDMSRIVSGKIRLDAQLTDVVNILEAAIDATRLSAEAKDIQLRTILDPQAGPVTADPTRLQQIFWNLLANAVKFTPKGGRVEVRLERVNSHLEIAVKDTGIGIKPEFLPLIFERFRQVDSSTTRSYGGLGLGLSIVKNLVELHGGTIRAQSAGEDRGSTFIVSLPLAPIRQQREGEHPKTDRGVVLDCEQLALDGITVLIVDDEADARLLIARLLTQCHATALCASSADEGLQALLDRKPDVLVSDIGMPGKDGYAFIRAVRKLSPEQGGRIPAVALTAFARSEDRTRAMMAGYQVHVSKPIEPQELLATIASLTGRAGRQP